MRNKEIYKNKFIEFSKNKFNNKFDYSKVEYENATTKVCIICPEHGEFWQTPNNHMHSIKGCPYCSAPNRNQTTEIFIKKCKERFGELYTYDKTKYVNDRTNVIITCKIHGDFKVRPNRFLNSKGCPKCAKTTTTEDFIERAREIHGTKYDYSKVVYKNTITPVTIICPNHGEFEQRPAVHLSGSGCPECAKNSIGNTHRLSRDEFINRATKLHFGKYGYDKVNYKNTETKVIITCPIHGDFKQTPNSHLKGYGCHMCKTSIGELTIEHWLKKFKIPYKKQFCVYLQNCGRKSNTIFVDFVLEVNNQQYFIEYNGEQHYKFCKNWHKTKEKFNEQLTRDIALRNYCKNKNINLLKIKYDQDVFNTLNEYFKTNIKKNLDES